MRPWILATIVLGALAIFLAVREASLSRQINALRHQKDDLTAQQGSLAERIAESERKLDIKPDQTPPSVPNNVNPTLSDNGQLPKRVTTLENQVRAIQSRISPEYDPTVDAPEPEADTNAAPKRNWGPEHATSARHNRRSGQDRSRQGARGSANYYPGRRVRAGPRRRARKRAC